MRASPRLDASNASTPNVDAESPGSYFESGTHAPSADRLHLSQHRIPSTSSNRFYRPPRSTSRASSSLSSETRESGVSGQRPSRATMNDSFGTLHEAPSPTIEESVPFSRAMCSSPSVADDHGSSDKESSPETPSGPARRQGLGPRWNDYSFRESDLYYGSRPREEASQAKDERAVESSQSSRQRPRKTLRQYLKRDHRGRNAPAKGFEVIRRPPPPGM